MFYLNVNVNIFRQKWLAIEAEHALQASLQREEGMQTNKIKSFITYLHDSLQN